MSENFEYAVQRTLKAEGVFSNDPMDPGGATKYGISSVLYHKWYLAHPEDRRPSVADIDIPMALRIYEGEFWKGLSLDEVQDRFVASELFDTAVNCGLIRAGLFAQRALNYLRKPGWKELREDGILGFETRAALNRVVAAGYRLPLLLAMNGEQYQHYKTLCQANPDRFLTFSRGWTRRLHLDPELLRLEGVLPCHG
jgi:lysozyme family protein